MQKGVEWKEESMFGEGFFLLKNEIMGGVHQSILGTSCPLNVIRCELLKDRIGVEKI